MNHPLPRLGAVNLAAFKNDTGASHITRHSTLEEQRYQWEGPFGHQGTQLYMNVRIPGNLPLVCFKEHKLRPYGRSLPVEES